MKRWPVILYAVVTLLVPATLLLGTMLTLLSEEFRSPVCWVKDTDHWVTGNEVTAMLTVFVVPASLLVSVPIGLVLRGLKKLSVATVVTLPGVAVGLAVLSYVVNLSVNDGYIDRLYAACGTN